MIDPDDEFSLDRGVPEAHVAVEPVMAGQSKVRGALWTGLWLAVFNSIAWANDGQS